MSHSRPSTRSCAIRVREELKRLQRELEITFIHVTHSQDEAMALADMMVVMEDGHIRQAGTPREVFGYPASSFVARFIGGQQRAAGRGRAGRHPCGPLPPGARDGACRPRWRRWSSRAARCASR